MRRRSWQIGLLVLLYMFANGCTESSKPEPARAMPPLDSVLPRDADRQFVLAAWKGDVARVRQLLRGGVDINTRFGGSAHAFTDEEGGWPMAGERWTALHAAATRRNLEVVRVLIAAGADLDLDDGYGSTALAMAVDVYTRDRQVDDVAVALIEAGAKVNTSSRVYIDGPGGETPLHRAAAWNQRRAVAALIAAGANVNAMQGWGETPLDYAVLCNSTEAADLLRAAGAKRGRAK